MNTIPCELCGKPTRMLGTKRCDPCWELERRIEMAPDIARKVLDGLQGEVVVTTKDGRCVAVTRQDKEGQILEVIWEAKP